MAARKGQAARDILVEMLGEERADRVRVFVDEFVSSQRADMEARAEDRRRREEEVAAYAASPTTTLGGHYDPFEHLETGLQRELYIMCIGQGAAPDMAWTRARESAQFFVAKVRESGK